MSNEWEEIHQSRPWGKHPDIHCVRQVKKFLAQHPAPLIPQALDIGCGAGANTGMMCDDGMEVYAIDSSETALAHMCNRLGDKPFFPHLCSVQEFEPPHQFDFILDNFALTYLEHPPWNRIMSWLKPGGWLIHASFEEAPKGTPKAWHHLSPGNVVERHSSWVEGNAFSFVVRKYVKP
jgi:trans-aconitate methyltransferase